MELIIAHRLAADLGDGVSDLDRDHADLLSLAHQFTRLHNANARHQADSVLRKLLCTAQAHWSREEGMLRHYGYPRTDDHARRHQAIRQNLSRLLAGCQESDAAACEDMVVRMTIDDHEWKWWFLDTGIRPTVRTTDDSGRAIP